MVTFNRSLHGWSVAENIVLDSNLIAGKHLWAGPRLQFGSRYFCSEEFKSALGAIDSGLCFDPVREQPGQPGDQY
jgi:hypothetical protein